MAIKTTQPVYEQNGQWVTKVYGTQLATVYEADPLQGIVQNLPSGLDWMKVMLSPWIAILAATILIIGTNAGIIGSSRLAYSMSQHKQLPPILGRVHPTRFTPYVSIILFGTVAALLIAPGSIAFLADLYAFGAMISFTVAHISVVVLRIKMPDYPRPWRTPINIPFRGKSIPVLAVIGAIGTFSVWCVVVATHAEGRAVGFAWMGIGVVAYVVYRRQMGYSLTKTVKTVPLPPSVAEDLVYDQILVPIVGSHITDEMMVLACQLATEKKSSIDGLHVIEVPMNLPLDASLAGGDGARREDPRGRGARRGPVQGAVYAAHRGSAPGRARHRRGGGHAAFAGDHRRYGPQATHRGACLRAHDRLRPGPRAMRGPPQSGAKGLPDRGVR